MLKRLFPILIFIFLFVPQVHAFWMWTPESNKWVNPKYSVKDTPKEQLQVGLQFYNVGDYPKAVNEFEKLIKHYPKAREAAEAQYYIATSLYKQGQLMKAFKSYQTVIEKYPFSDRSAEIVKTQFGIGNELLEGKDKRSKFIQTVVGGEYDVVQVFRSVIKNAPYGEYAPQAQYKIGLYLQEKGMYQESRDEFEKAMNDYPNTEWAKAAKYQMAVSDAKRSSKAQYDQKVTQSAVGELKDFIKEYPEADLTEKAKEQIHGLNEKEAENNFLVGRFYEKQKRIDAAKVYYSAIVDKYNGTSWAKKALERLQEINRRK